jgi:creatinine amidohydrolase/Fe(II)-dependent formamide hydrolase-like protein
MDPDAWNHMTAVALRQRAAGGVPVLLPVGATEQHGPHLPTGVDDFLAAEAKGDAVLDACAEALADWLIQWAPPPHPGTARGAGMRARSATA